VIATDFKVSSFLDLVNKYILYLHFKLPSKLQDR